MCYKRNVVFTEDEDSETKTTTQPSETFKRPLFYSQMVSTRFHVGNNHDQLKVEL